ncbi:MAG: hypothetical protein IK073_01300 [Paludibacteraceae bacterium]|nr:hypothetical protein [Paludibacteraceae bacterium]
MKAKYILGIIAVALGLTACENYFDEKYMDNGDPYISVVKTYDYTLTAADYATIANNATNKALAREMDSIKGFKNRYQNALANVAKNGCFSNNATADMYAPAFIYNKYPQLDPGSIFNLTYLTDDGLPPYLRPYNSASRVVLDITDPTLIPDMLPQPDEGQIIGVVYDDQEALYISEDGYVWQPLVLPANIHLLPAEANGQVINWLRNNFPYAEADQLEVVIRYDEALKHYVAYEYTFDGETWNVFTGVTEETMSFMLDPKKGWAANLSTYYQQAVAGDGNMGKLTIQDFDLEDGISYIWLFDNLYGMKGTAYAKGGPHYGEGWFVTPKIKLKNAVSPALSFDMAMNYGPLPEDGRYEQATVWVSTDYAGDVKTATWTQLPWNEFDGNTGFPDANSWTFFNTGRLDLSAWNNQIIYIGFRYKSLPGQTCSTWEVKNILVNEPEEAE